MGVVVLVGCWFFGLVFFRSSDELLNANSATQGRKKQIIFLLSLLISQLLSSWRMPLVSSFCILS